MVADGRVSVLAGAAVRAGAPGARHRGDRPGDYGVGAHEPAGGVAGGLGRRPAGPTRGGRAGVRRAGGRGGGAAVGYGFTGYVLANALFGAVFGAAAVVPGALLADAIPRERAGEASGLNYVASDLGGVLGPIGVGLLLDAAGYGAATGLAAAPAVLAAGAIALARRQGVR